MEISWFFNMWSFMLAFFVAGVVFGNCQSMVLGYVCRFIKRGFGIADKVPMIAVIDDPVIVPAAGPRLRTVGTQSQTNYDMTLTRFDTMRFVAQNQGFFRAGEVEVINH